MRADVSNLGNEIQIRYQPVECSTNADKIDSGPRYKCETDNSIIAAPGSAHVLAGNKNLNLC